MLLSNSIASRQRSSDQQLLDRRLSQRRLTLLFTGLSVLAIAAPAPISAQTTQATVQEILDGNQVFIQNRRAAVKDVARQQQQVRTGNSRTSLLFNTGAVARLSPNSVLNIGQCARLRRGSILVNGAVNACSASITTGVRGTTYLLEVDEAGGQQVKVLEGEVIVTRNAEPIKDEAEDLPSEVNSQPAMIKPSIAKPTSAPIDKSKDLDDSSDFSTSSPTSFPSSGSNPINPRQIEPLKVDSANGQPILRIEGETTPNTNSQKTPQQDTVILKAGEKVAVKEDGILGVIQQITENEFVGLLNGSLFNGFTNQIPGIDKLRSSFNNLFPGVDFPIPIPNIPKPSLPMPSLPRSPF
jgi:hypothetical protein